MEQIYVRCAKVILFVKHVVEVRIALPVTELVRALLVTEVLNAKPVEVMDIVLHAKIVMDYVTTTMVRDLFIAIIHYPLIQ
jgi:hypothetical protein